MMQTENRPRTPLEYVRLFFIGAAMGTADIIPGVSGGTMAFILGIYEELLEAIKSVNFKTIRLLLQFKLKDALALIPWQFLIVLVAGILGAGFSLAHLMSWLLDNQPVFLFAFFFGLILASIIAVGAHIVWTPRSITTLVIGAIGAYFLVGMVPLDMSHDPLTLFFSGATAIMAMILPGISGSFILLILGQYEYVLNAVKAFDIVSIAAVGVGAVVGLVGFARLLSWLLKHYHQATVAVLIGFMIGSLRVIWPWKVVLATMIDRHGEEVPIQQMNVLPNFGSSEFWIALALCIVGFALVTALDHMQTKSNPLLRALGMGSPRDAGVATAD